MSPTPTEASESKMGQALGALAQGNAVLCVDFDQTTYAHHLHGVCANAAKYLDDMPEGKNVITDLLRGVQEHINQELSTDAEHVNLLQEINDTLAGKSGDERQIAFDNAVAEICGRHKDQEWFKELFKQTLLGSEESPARERVSAVESLFKEAGKDNVVVITHSSFPRITELYMDIVHEIDDPDRVVSPEKIRGEDEAELSIHGLRQKVSKYEMLGRWQEKEKLCTDLPEASVLLDDEPKNLVAFNEAENGYGYQIGKNVDLGAENIRDFTGQLVAKKQELEITQPSAQPSKTTSLTALTAQESAFVPEAEVLAPPLIQEDQPGVETFGQSVLDKLIEKMKQGSEKYSLTNLLGNAKSSTARNWGKTDWGLGEHEESTRDEMIENMNYGLFYDAVMGKEYMTQEKSSLKPYKDKIDQWIEKTINETREDNPTPDEYCGIGAELECKDGKFVVTKDPEEGTPAHAMGLKVGDVIVGVGEDAKANEDTQDLDAKKIIDAIRVKPGEDVYLKIEGQDTPLTTKATIIERDEHSGKLQEHKELQAAKDPKKRAYYEQSMAQLGIGQSEQPGEAKEQEVHTGRF